MSIVPPVHFQVGFPIPAIIGKTRLLGWIVSGALDTGKVLGKDDPSLQFKGSGIGAAGEVDDAARQPEIAPGGRIGDPGKNIPGGMAQRVVPGKPAGERKYVFRRGRYQKIMRGLLL